MTTDQPITDTAASDGDVDEGAIIVVGPQVYFIPRDDLRTFKVPAAVAKATIAEIDERSVLRRGHPNDPIILGGELGEDGTTVAFSSFVEHCLTVSRLH